MLPRVRNAQLREDLSAMLRSHNILRASKIDA
jgi:hypothetical protein